MYKHCNEHTYRVINRNNIYGITEYDETLEIDRYLVLLCIIELVVITTTVLLVSRFDDIALRSSQTSSDTDIYSQTIMYRYHRF